MADAEIEDVREALKQFRSDILNEFASIQVGITALRWAVAEATPLTEARWATLQKKAMENVERFRERYAHAIALAHETR